MSVNAEMDMLGSTVRQMSTTAPQVPAEMEAVVETLLAIMNAPVQLGGKENSVRKTKKDV